MKTMLSGFFLPVLVISLTTQFATPVPGAESAAPQPSDYSVVERGAHHRIWERVTYESTPSGKQVARAHRYTELATGMHYWADGQWNESQELIESYPGGAIARHGAHKVIFANNLNTAGAIDLEMPDGRRMQSHILGLGYFDSASGKSVMIAEVKDCQGQLVGGNQVIYPDAFTDFRASVRLTYSRAGLEQDVILEERPPSPEDYELDPATTKLMVLTEFVSPAQPGIQTVPVDARAEAMPDQFLDFGVMEMGPGTAFTIDQTQTASGRIPVAKEWAVIEGRNVLLEQVAVPKVAGALKRLPLPVHSSATKAVSDSVRHLVSIKPHLPGPKVARSSDHEMKLAKLELPATGLVLDYTLLNSTQTNYTFKGDTTYYISGSVTLKGTNILEGGAVLKYARYTNASSAQIKFNNSSGLLSCQTSPYRPAIFTAKDDNTVGETIAGSTGVPTNSYGAYALYFYQSGLTNPTSLHDLRIRNAEVGIGAFYGIGPVVANVQFVNCANSFLMLSPAEVTLRNVLVAGGSSVFTAQDACTARCEQVTFHQAGELVSSGGDAMSVYLTNSLVIATSTNYASPLSGVSNQFLAGDSGIFLTAGAGQHYLATNSPYRNLGTTNINAPLLAELRQRSTYPPLVYSNVTILTNLTFDARPIRYTNGAPDLGYHYNAMDYLVSNCRITNAALVVTNGAVIGYYDDLGLVLQDGAAIASVGTPQTPNRFAHYLTVQEQAVHLGAYATGTGLPIAPYRDTGVGSPGTFRFTEFTRLAPSTTGSGSANDFCTDEENLRFSQLTLSDCTLAGGGCYFEMVSSDVFMFQNNCFERSDFTALHLGSDSSAITLRNNLFHYRAVFLYNNGDAAWTVKDNAFDSGDLSGDSPMAEIHSHNAYINNSGRLSPTNAYDVVLTSFAYTNGPLGNFYQLSTALIDQGSRPADDAGLYHYTTQTNQVKETNSVVDIGYHYVALNTNGSPFDTDGDGVFDYLDSDSTPLTDIVWSNSVWSWKADSLAWNCWTNALACTNGAQGDFYLIFVDTPTNIVRNTNFWLRKFQGWTAYSLWNNCNTNLWPTNTDQTCSGATTYQQAGVMVSPEHVLTTGHMGFPTNQWLAFMDTNSNVVWRRVKDYFNGNYGTTNYTGLPNGTTNMPYPPIYDYFIGLLDEPVPDSIGYVKISPTNWWAWFDAPFYNNTTNNTYHVPLYIQNCQHRAPVMKDLVSLTCSSGHRTQTFDLLTLTNWNHGIEGGDSGSPWFITLDGELCLAKLVSSALVFGVEYEYNDSAYMQASVNAAMSELSLRNGRTNIYALTVKDLSTYPIYHQSPYNCSP